MQVSPGTAIMERIGVSAFTDDELSFASLQRQFAKNLTPQRIAGVFDDAAQSIADQIVLADEIEEADDHIRGTLALRRSAVQRLDKKVIPGDEDDERSKVAAELAGKMIEKPWFHKLSASMLRATFLQYSAVEVLYETTSAAKFRVKGAPADLYMPTGVRPVESQRWHFNRQAKPELFRRLNSQSENDTIPLLPGRFTWMEWETTAIPGQFAIVRCAAVLYIMARVDIKQWGTMIDQWGVPFISAMVEDGVSKEARREIAAELLALAGRRVVLTSKGAQLQTTEVPDQSPHENFQNWVRRAISKLFVGQDSSQNAIEGQKTGATLQGQVRDDIRDEDALQLDAAQTETFFAPWCALNFGPDVAPPRIKRSPPEDIDPAARIPVFKGAKEMGIAVKKEQIYRELKLEVPDEDDETIFGVSETEADLAFKRDVIRAFLADGTINDVLYNAVQIQQLLEAVNLPTEPNFEEPWLPVITQPGLAVTGEPVKDSEGDVVGSGVTPTPALPGQGSGFGVQGFAATRGAESTAGAAPRREIDPSAESVVARASRAWADIFGGHSKAIRTLAEEIAAGSGTDAEKLAALKKRLPEIFEGLDDKQRRELLHKGQLAALARGSIEAAEQGKGTK